MFIIAYKGSLPYSCAKKKKKANMDRNMLCPVISEQWILKCYSVVMLTYVNVVSSLNIGKVIGFSVML